MRNCNNGSEEIGKIFSIFLRVLTRLYRSYSFLAKVKILLEPIPKKRLSINEMLEDEWFKMDVRLQSKFFLVNVVDSKILSTAESSALTNIYLWHSF